MLTIITGLLCGALLAGAAVVLVEGPNGNIDELKGSVQVAENALTQTHDSLGKGSR